MHTEDINEPIDILATFARTRRDTALVVPKIMHWRGRSYNIATLGFRYPTTQGRRMVHRFTFVIDDTNYEVEFDAERLTWQLLRLTDGLAG